MQRLRGARAAASGTAAERLLAPIDQRLEHGARQLERHEQPQARALRGAPARPRLQRRGLAGAAAAAAGGARRWSSGRARRRATPAGRARGRAPCRRRPLRSRRSRPARPACRACRRPARRRRSARSPKSAPKRSIAPVGERFGDLLRHRAVALDQLRLDPEEVGLGLVRVGHDPAREVCATSRGGRSGGSTAGRRCTTRRPPPCGRRAAA